MSPLAQEQRMLLAAAGDSTSESTVSRPACAPFGCAAAAASAAALVILSAGAGAIVHHKFSSTAEVGLSLRTGSKAGAADSKRTLGPSRPAAVAAAASKADRTALTLYCVTVMQQGTYEQSILQWQVDQCASDLGIGIFGCDGYDVFSAGHALIFGICHGQSIKTVDLPVALSHHNFTVDGSIANGLAFRNMWSSLTTKRSYLKNDFTVKVDPDTVFFAHRLRRQLRQQDHPARCFVSNCWQGDASRRLSGPQHVEEEVIPGSSSSTIAGSGIRGSGAAGNYVGPSFYGSLEIISSAALETYAVQANNPCPHFVGQNWGEDRFMAACLGHLDIPFVTNFNLLSDQYCVNAPIDCDGKASAFHPFKSAAEWQECFQNASQFEAQM